MVIAQMADNPIILRYLPPKHERVAAAIAERDLKVTGLLMAATFETTARR